MGHWKKVNGKMTYFDVCESGAAAILSVKPEDLKPGQKVALSNKSHTYLGMTEHNGEVHHFQQDSNKEYKSYPTNTVPPMQSRDVMEVGSKD